MDQFYNPLIRTYKETWTKLGEKFTSVNGTTYTKNKMDIPYLEISYSCNITGYNKYLELKKFLELNKIIWFPIFSKGTITIDQDVNDSETVHISTDNIYKIQKHEYIKVDDIYYKIKQVDRKFSTIILYDPVTFTAGKTSFLYRKFTIDKSTSVNRVSNIFHRVNVKLKEVG